jgi:hypothetical protein
MKKSQNVLIWLSKMVLAQHFFGQFAEAGKRHQKKNLTPAREEVCNEYDDLRVPFPVVSE